MQTYALHSITNPNQAYVIEPFVLVGPMAIPSVVTRVRVTNYYR